MQMNRLRLVVLTVLAGCASVPETPSPVTVPLRNPTVSVASQSDVTVARLVGSWTVVEGAGVAAGADLRVSDRTVTLDGVTLPLAAIGQGRFRFGEEVVWVHWLDFDDRTAALGNPDGSRVWIMDRTGRPAERLTAARDILTWYGYDVGRLKGRSE